MFRPTSLRSSVSQTDRRPLAAGLVVFVAIALSACGADSSASNTPEPRPVPPTTALPPKEPPMTGTDPTLDGTRWVQVDGPGRFRLMDGRYSATVGCNGIGGDVVLAGPTLTLKPGMSTQMYCEGLMDAEGALRRDLDAVAGWRIEAGKLTLVDAGGRALRVFAPERDAPLAGTWTLNTLVEGDAVSSSATGTAVQLVIGADGTVSGSDGCNRITATVTTTGTAPAGRSPLRFGPIASTRMACEPAVMQRAAALTAALGKTAGWSTEGTRLSLYDASGALLVTFTSA
jgi:heat shock protein HslJ